jgi:ABC-2 type transport system permease protein
VVALVTVVLGTGSAFAALYPTVESRLPFARSVASTPALLALTGPAFDLTSIGGLVAWRVGSLGAVLIALMGIFAVVRHTRADEEAGRLELVGSGVVGRRAPLTAALVTVFGASAIIGLLVAGGLVGMGMPAAGALALGLGLASCGCMFAAIAGVTAQLTENGRLASGMAGGLLALSFLLRAAGDSSGASGLSWLSWVSPMGWTQQVRPFAGERWWVFGLVAGFVVVLLAAAYVLVGRRDIGAGLLPQRLGPAKAAPGLRSPLALAWRLHRGALLGWAAGFAVFGAVLGALAEGVADLLKGNPQLERFLEAAGGAGGIVDTYLSSTLGILGLVASAYAVQATLRLRSEETGLRAEPVLATRTSRIQWAASHLVVAAFGTTVILLAGGPAGRRPPRPRPRAAARLPGGPGRTPGRSHAGQPARCAGPGRDRGGAVRAGPRPDRGGVGSSGLLPVVGAARPHVEAEPFRDGPLALHARPQAPRQHPFAGPARRPDRRCAPARRCRPCRFPLPRRRLTGVSASSGRLGAGPATT